MSATADTWFEARGPNSLYCRACGCVMSAGTRWEHQAGRRHADNVHRQNRLRPAPADAANAPAPGKAAAVTQQQQPPQPSAELPAVKTVVPEATSAALAAPPSSIVFNTAITVPRSSLPDALVIKRQCRFCVGRRWCRCEWHRWQRCAGGREQCGRGYERRCKHALRWWRSLRRKSQYRRRCGQCRSWRGRVHARCIDRFECWQQQRRLRCWG